MAFEIHAIFALLRRRLMGSEERVTPSRRPAAYRPILTPRPYLLQRRTDRNIVGIAVHHDLRLLKWYQIQCDLGPPAAGKFVPTSSGSLLSCDTRRCQANGRA